MKVQIHSDLHLEFGGDIEDQDLLEPKADILVLAGDITTSPIGMFEYLDSIQDKWELIIVVLGNHEHYNGSHYMLDERAFRYESIISSLGNVKLLDNEVFEYKGKKFYGGTKWTHMESRECDNYRRYMNDSRYVTPMEIQHSNKAFTRGMPEKCDMVISHHAPDMRSVNEKYYGKETNALYAESYGTALDKVDAKVWVHGHMHDPCDYVKDGTRVICNPRGYCGHEERAKQIEYVVVEI